MGLNLDFDVQNKLLLEVFLFFWKMFFEGWKFYFIYYGYFCYQRENQFEREVNIEEIEQREKGGIEEGRERENIILLEFLDLVLFRVNYFVYGY